MTQIQEKSVASPRVSFGGETDAIFVPESFGVALALGASCWLLDAFLSATLAGASLKTALIPGGEALALRGAVALLVAIAAAITSSFLIRELRIRREENAPDLPQTETELLDSFSDSAFTVNRRGEIIDANEAAAKLFSWPVNMFMPMKIDWLISEYIDERCRDIQSFSEIARRDPKCCGGRSIAVIGKALSGQKFVADLDCMPSSEDDERYIIFVRERADRAISDDRSAAVAA